MKFKSFPISAVNLSDFESDLRAFEVIIFRLILYCTVPCI